MQFSRAVWPIVGRPSDGPLGTARCLGRWAGSPGMQVPTLLWEVIYTHGLCGEVSSIECTQETCPKHLLLAVFVGTLRGLRLMDVAVVFSSSFLKSVLAPSVCVATEPVPVDLASRAAARFSRGIRFDSRWEGFPPLLMIDQMPRWWNGDRCSTTDCKHGLTRHKFT